jgi:hypothetical protein
MQWDEKREEAFSYYFGDQWDDELVDILSDQNRPAFTINRIKPLINRLSGYQRLNRYEPVFRMRNQADPWEAEVRKGITKWIFDETAYEKEKSAACLHSYICGLGWLETFYEFDWGFLDGKIKIQCVSPRDIFWDCNSQKSDFSDSIRIHRAKWMDKGKAKEMFPDQAEEIEAWTLKYDEAENQDLEEVECWYRKDEDKIRMVETWWKEYGPQPVYLLNDNSKVTELTDDQRDMVVDTYYYDGYRIYYTSYLGEVELTAPKPSIDFHNEFPFTPVPAYYLAEGDLPTGVVGDLIGVQDEINKTRSQAMHIINTGANSGWQAEQGALSESQRQEYEENSATPGVLLTYRAGHNAPQKITPAPFPVGVVQMEQTATSDIYSLSNINPQEFSTQPMQTPESGRAIELKQRVGHAGINILFDNLRNSEHDILCKIWGRGKRQGLAQQWLTDEMAVRILDNSGKEQFVTVNQQIQFNHPILGQIHRTIHDLTMGEFDFEIANVPVTPTQRQTQYWQLVDACAQLGIPGQTVLPFLLDLSDIPQAQEIKKAFLEMQEKQQQMAGMAAQINHQPLPPRVSISYKGELPPAEQLQAAAKLVGLQPHPADYGLPPPPSPSPQQIAQAVLASALLNKVYRQQQQPQENILTGHPVPINPAMIRQNYLQNKPKQSVNRMIQPVSQESMRAGVSM